MSDELTGERIRALRKQLGLSQIELAELLDVSNVTVNRWEHDRSAPQPQTAERLLRAEQEGVEVLRQSSQRVPGNLPRSATPLLGRTSELLRTGEMIEPGTVVTITGTGGIGKTRLSLDLVLTAAERFRDGTWFVDLAAVSDPAVVEHTVARVLGLRESGKQPLIDRLQETMRERELLVLLDNCEHLLTAAAEIAKCALGSSSAVLATSRAPLGFAGERVVLLEPLAATAAAELFEARARAQQGSAAIDSAREGAVDILCRRLDRLPLAIELAAARTHVLSVEQIADRIDRRFELLRVAGGGEERRRALDAAIAWSWDLLQPNEAVLLRRLSVFAGIFDLEAVESVVDVENTLDLLDSLARQSMIVVEQDARTFSARYRLLDSLAAYARNQLVAANEFERIAGNHAVYYQELAIRTLAALRTEQQVAALATLDRNYENIRVALDRTIADRPGEPAIGFASSLTPYWMPRGLFIEGSNWLSRALATAGNVPTEAVVGALAGRGRLLINAGQIEDAERVLLQSTGLAIRFGDRRGEAAARDNLGLAYRGRSDLIAAAEQHQRAFDLYRGLEDRVGAASARLNLALIAGLGGDDEAAERGLHEAWALLRGSGNIAAEAGVLANLGGVANSLGRTQEAIGYYDRAIEHFRMLGDRDRMVASIGNTAEVRCTIGDFSGAFQMIQEVETQFRQSRNAIQLAGTLWIKAVAEAGMRRQQEALVTFRESLQLYHELDDWMDVTYVLEAIAHLHAEQGDARFAARLMGGAEHLREMHRVPEYPLLNSGAVDRAITIALNPSERDEAAKTGWAQSPDGLVADALHAGSVNNGRPTLILSQRDNSRPPKQEEILTPRQAQILKMVASGGSNRTIAEALAISDRTVERHLSTIFMLLDVDSRAAAVAAAVARGLI